MQVNKIYELKHKGVRGGIPHALIVTACFVTLSWPYLKIPGLWGFVFFLGIAHLFQDSVKITYGKIKYSLWSYLLDQFLHIALIAIIFLTGLKDVEPPRSTSGLIMFYNNNTVIIYLIAIIIATYNGFYLIRNFKNTFFKEAGRYTRFEKWYGMLERAGVVSLFLCGGIYLVFIPIILFLRPFIFATGSKTLHIDKQFISLSEMLLSWTIAIVTGMGLYLIAQRL